MNLSIPIISLKGTPYEIGCQHGEHLKTQIIELIDRYKSLFAYYGVDSISEKESGERKIDSIYNDVKKYQKFIQKYSIDLWEEMKGISVGSGIKLDDIVMLNSRTEILSVLRPEFEKKAFECTAIAIEPKRSIDNKTILSQNWDWYEAFNGLSVILKISDTKNSIDITALTEVGGLGIIGMNSYGIGLCTNFLECGYTSIGVPVNIIRRGIISAKRLTPAIDAITSFPRAAGANYLIAHKGGCVINIETTAEDVDFIYSENGVLIHTNHYNSVSMRIYNQSLAGCSSVRYLRAKQLVEDNEGEKFDIQTIKAILTDHFDRPTSICRHPDTTLHKFEQTSTLASIIMDLSEGKMYVSSEQGCENEYKLVS